ncbi:uncharacterized protein LOC108865985 [Pyrus x bretschneideri]|uniref:uncharacterized protein LOC108865985 n=1 Tax=Pyrus x bretschneideri TaxID=225117 RepID=UPI00202E72F7|nr:uncharacterized protein LOC108865985 [Pyrus x bretschneideri]
MSSSVLIHESRKQMWNEQEGYCFCRSCSCRNPSHGFFFGRSASSRYNIPELAKKYKVCAIDLLGFGWSEKALVDYDALVWRDQVVDFLKEIVKEPTVLVGNSLGGFTTLVAAAGLPEQVVGVALLNSAGQFGNPNSEAEESWEETALQKFILKPFMFDSRILLCECKIVNLIINYFLRLAFLCVYVSISELFMFAEEFLRCRKEF